MTQRKLMGNGHESAQTYYSQNSFPVSFANNLYYTNNPKEIKPSLSENASFLKQCEEQPLYPNSNRYLIEKIYQQQFPLEKRQNKQFKSKELQKNNNHQQPKDSKQLQSDNYWRTKEDIIKAIYIPKTKTRFRTTMKSCMTNQSQSAIKSEKDKQKIMPKIIQHKKKQEKITNNVLLHLNIKRKANKTTRDKFQLSSARVNQKSNSKIDLSQVLNSMPKFQPQKQYTVNFPKLFESPRRDHKFQVEQEDENPEQQLKSYYSKQNPVPNIFHQHFSQGQQGVQKLISTFQPHTTTYQKMDKSGFKIKKYKNGVYFGQLSQDQKKYGVGIIFYNNGKLYQGQFSEDLKNGKGYQLYVDSSFYEGEYINGYKQGKGRFVWSNGQVYDGEWSKGKKHGSGMWKASKTSKQSYIGQWFNGKPHGFGVYINEIGDRYQGQFKNGLKEGHGTERYTNGDLFVGGYIKGRKTGVGEHRYSNGDIYTGQFCNNLKHGKGKYIQFKTNQIYEGNYRNDNISGDGQYLFSDGAVYSGSFQNNLIHGQGSVTYRDDVIRQGYWINGIKMQQPSETQVKQNAAQQFASIRNSRKKRLNIFAQEKQPTIYIPKKQTAFRNIGHKSVEQCTIKEFARKCSCLGHRRSLVFN